MTSGGVAIGARKPYQLSASTSVRPCSTKVFKSGSAGERLVEPMPIALNVPAFTCGSSTGMSANIHCT